MKGLLSTRPNTIGIIVYGGSKSHIKDLHTIKSQIELKHSNKGIQTISMTRMFMEEIEDVEFDTNGRIVKAKKVKNVNVQIWGTTRQNEDILFK